MPDERPLTAKTGSKARLIVRVPGIHGGDPVVRGTRVPVRSIVVVYEQYGGDLQRAGEAFRLTPEEIAAALAYYEAHRDEIDRSIEEHEQAASR